MKKPEYIDMKGLLSFHIAWILKQRRMCGEDLIAELGRRRNDEPSPGTLYPALNKLKKEGLVQSEREEKKVVCGLTPKGKKDLELAISYFKSVYGEVITGAVALKRAYSYIPSKKKTSEKDELQIDFICGWLSARR
jgi:PadR family transcriptional regulator PadR